MRRGHVLGHRTGLGAPGDPPRRRPPGRSGGAGRLFLRPWRGRNQAQGGGRSGRRRHLVGERHRLHRWPRRPVRPVTVQYSPTAMARLPFTLRFTPVFVVLVAAAAVASAMSAESKASAFADAAAILAVYVAALLVHEGAHAW